MTAGIILSAGASSRMGSFKPMMPIGNTTFIKLIIHRMKDVGLDPIIVVTGFRKEELERHVADEGVICIHNEHFYRTQMLDSVKLALAAVPEKCARVMLTPVDAVLAGENIFQEILSAKGDFIRPVYKNRPGHPVVIGRALFSYILGYRGSGGLRGAAEASGCVITEVPLNNEDAVLDADTREQYRAAVEKYDALSGKEGAPHMEIQARLFAKGIVCDPAFMQLLELIKETGSLRKAASAMHISYTKGWKTVKDAEEKLKYPLVNRHAGGAGGGASSLSTEGEEFLRRYKEMMEDLEIEAEKIFEKHFSGYRL